MDKENELRRQIAALEARLALLAEVRSKIEGKRDRLVLKLVDNEGAHDRRFAGVR
jgi:hypothetical protein